MQKIILKKKFRELSGTMENMRNHRDIKLVATEKKKELFSIRTKLSYYNFFHKFFFDYINK